jgi:glycosyltransferase involved in cell wall biosynthesis
MRGRQEICRFAPDLVIHNEAVPIPLPALIMNVVNDLQKSSSRMAPLWGAIRKLAARYSDCLIATTHELQAELCRELRMDPTEIAVVTKCVDLSTCTSVPLPQRERAIFHSGTLPYKDPVATLRAFNLLADATATLYVAGEVTVAVARAMDEFPAEIGARVKLLGEVDGATVRAHHARARVASFPSKYTVPVGSSTVLEAIASCTPILGSPDLSKDVLVHGANGIVCETDPRALCSGMRALLNDDDLWTDLSEGARQMRRRFGAPDVAKQYLKLYEVSRAASSAKRTTPHAPYP